MWLLFKLLWLNIISFQLFAIIRSVNLIILTFCHDNDLYFILYNCILGISNFGFLCPNWLLNLVNDFLSYNFSFLRLILALFTHNNDYIINKHSIIITYVIIMIYESTLRIFFSSKSMINNCQITWIHMN